MRTQTRLVLIASLGTAFAGCQTPAPAPAPSPRPPRVFDEKIQCASIGERWQKAQCLNEHGQQAMPCFGWWTYDAKRDTCIGVFVTRSRDLKATTLTVYDLLTGVELEQWNDLGSSLGAVEAHLNAVKDRWIVAGSSGSPSAVPTPSK